MSVKRIFISRLVLVLVFAIMVMGLWTLWPENNGQKETEKITVVASFYPIYFFAGEIGGEKLEVINITPDGVEPHDYEPTAKEVAIMQKAGLVLLNGGGFEAWGGRMKADLANSGVKVVEVSEGDRVAADPHVWLSPTLAIEMAEKIAGVIAETDPVNGRYYEDNLRKLKERLAVLDSKYAESLKECKKRDMVTAHAAFGHLAGAYGLNQVAISGSAPDEEPSAGKLAEVASFAKRNEVKYIFFERLMSPRLAETIAEEIGVKMLILDPLEGISDNDEEAGKDYFTIMEENLINLREALECR